VIFNDEILNEILTKNYSINDINKMVILLKKYKVPASEFKKLLNISEEINKQVLDNLYEIGDITDNELVGCYETSIAHSIKITAKKEDEWEDDNKWGDDDDWT